jgi:hypothetical protein
MKNEKYSHGFWTGQDLTTIDPKDLNETVIINACFAQEKPFTDCFPKDMTGVTFENCNLDNCNIPPGNTVKGGTNKQITEQADGEIWIVDKDLKPLSPLKPWRFDVAGLSKDPAMIETQAAMRISPSTKAGASTKKLPVTLVKEHIEAEEIKKLISDPTRLRAVLTAEGKI